MTAFARTRILSAGSHTGYWSNSFDGSSGSETLPLGSYVCEDTVEVPLNRSVDHGLNIEAAVVKPGTVSGKGAFGVYSWRSMPHGSQTTPFAHIDLSSVPPSNVEAATQAAARSNPGRPDVSLPVFLSELRDLPSMLQKRGNRKRAKPRNSVAEQNFGWDSLFRDVGNMFKFTEQVNDRVKELTALHSSSGLKRKKTIWRASSHETSSPLTIWSLEGTYCTAEIVASRQAKLWVSTRWRPAVKGLPPSADKLLQQARLAVHGWRISPADAWELMPWSWFSDYFFNVGDYLEATSNRSEFSLESICIMRWDVTYRSFRIIGTAGPISVSPGSTRYETKVRSLGSLGITATQPFLSAKQVTTLAGIIANR